MYLVGQTVTDVALTTSSAAGVLEADAGVVFTVTRPDGTTSTPATTNPSVGTYQALYVPTMAGRHTWTATTTTHGPQSGVFNVEPLVSQSIISLAEAKAHLNLASTVNDEEIRSFVLAATQWVEGRIGHVVQTTVTEIATPGRDGMLYLNHPVISLTTVVSAYGAAGATYSAATLTAQSPELSTGKVWLGLAWGLYGPLLVTYQAGRTVVPELIKSAVKDYLKWDWLSQRGASPSPVDLADEMSALPGTVPYKILQKLAPYMPAVVA